MKSLILDFEKTLAHRKLSTTDLISSFQNIIHLESGIDIREIQKIEDSLRDFGDSLFKINDGNVFTSLNDEKKRHEKYYTTLLNKLGVSNKGLVDKLINLRMNKIEYQVYPETKEALNILMNQLDLYILSNALPSRINEIKNLGLSKFIKEIFVTAYIGYEKNDIKCFEVILNKIGLNTQEIVFVDDTPEFIDIAEIVDIESYLIDHENKHTKYTKNNKINNLNELIKKLKEIDDRSK